MQQFGLLNWLLKVFLLFFTAIALMVLMAALVYTWSFCKEILDASVGQSGTSSNDKVEDLSLVFAATGGILTLVVTIGVPICGILVYNHFIQYFVSNLLKDYIAICQGYSAACTGILYAELCWDKDDGWKSREPITADGITRRQKLAFGYLERALSHFKAIDGKQKEIIQVREMTISNLVLYYSLIPLAGGEAYAQKTKNLVEELDKDHAWNTISRELNRLRARVRYADSFADSGYKEDILSVIDQVSNRLDTLDSRMATSEIKEAETIKALIAEKRSLITRQCKSKNTKEATFWSVLRELQNWLKSEFKA